MSGPMTPAGYEMLQIPTSPATGDVLKRTSAAAISGCLRQGGSNPVPVARPLEDYEAAERPTSGPCPGVQFQSARGSRYRGQSARVTEWHREPDSFPGC